MTTRQGTAIDNVGHGSIEQFQETALNVMYNVASIFTMPVEIFIRPHFGTRYFSAPNMFLSAVMLTLAASLFSLAEGAARMIPFVHVNAPEGTFGIGSMVTLVFLANIVHSIRIWRRMLDMSREENSMFEGPALPFFHFLPKGDGFWFVRIIYEPVFVYATSVVLGTFLIIQGPLMLYLQVAALLLAMKNYISWYRLWSYIRNLMDMANAAPTIARIVNNSASDDEMARIHMASLSKNLPPEIRKATVAHLSRAYSVPKEEE